MLMIDIIVLSILMIFFCLVGVNGVAMHSSNKKMKLPSCKLILEMQSL